MENFRKRMKSNSLKYKVLKLKWCQTREKPGFWHRTFDWLRIMKCPSEIKSFDYSRNLLWLLMEFPLVRCHIFKQGCIWLESFKFSFLLFSVGLHLEVSIPAWGFMYQRLCTLVKRGAGWAMNVKFLSASRWIQRWFHLFVLRCMPGNEMETN